jgi:hypothetical protein
MRILCFRLPRLIDRQTQEEQQLADLSFSSLMSPGVPEGTQAPRFSIGEVADFAAAMPASPSRRPSAQPSPAPSALLGNRTAASSPVSPSQVI